MIEVKQDNIAKILDLLTDHSCAIAKGDREMVEAIDLDDEILEK